MIADPPGMLEEAAMKLGRWLANLRLPSAGGAAGAVAGLGTKPTADFASFALACLIVSKGHSVDVSALYPAYCRYAETADQSPMPKDQFDRLFEKLCEAAKVQPKRAKNKLYMEGLRLVA